MARVWTAVFMLHSGHVETISCARYIVGHQSCNSTWSHKDAWKMYILPPPKGLEICHKLQVFFFFFFLRLLNIERAAFVLMGTLVFEVVIILRWAQSEVPPCL